MSEIAPERFAFQVYSSQNNWVIVLDEVWELLRRDPPLVWVVTIRELPEEREQREFLRLLSFMSNYWMKTHPYMCMQLCHLSFHEWTSGADETGIKLEERNSRRWKHQLLACVTGISVALFAGVVGIGDGSLRGHLKTGAITAAIQVLILVLIDGYSAK